MTTVIALLRGVNVGGHRKIRMDALKNLCESLGLDSPRTFIQSGNVVFRTRQRSLAKLAGRLQDAIEQSHGFRPEVMLRTRSELQEVIGRNPFTSRANMEPAKLVVVFLTAEPAAAARRKFAEIRTSPEQMHLIGREIHIYFPNGIGPSKLNTATLERALKTPGTGRNWNSVNKLLALAEQVESGA